MWYRVTTSIPLEEIGLMQAIGIVVSSAARGDRQPSSSGGQGTRHLAVVPVPDDEGEAFISIRSSALDAETVQVKPPAG